MKESCARLRQRLFTSDLYLLTKLTGLQCGVIVCTDISILSFLYTDYSEASTIA